MTELRMKTVASGAVGNSQIPQGRRTNGNTRGGKYFAYMLERVLHVSTILNQKTVLPSLIMTVMEEVADRVVHNRVSPKVFCSVLYSYLFLIKKGTPRSALDSGVGLKALLKGKMVVKNSLAHALKDTSHVFTSVAPEEE